MAMHYREVAEAMERDEGQDHDAHAQLSEEARDVRNAGRKLETSDEQSEEDIVGAIGKLQELIVEQRASNEAIAKQMRSMVYTMRDMLDEVDRLKKDSVDTSHTAQQAALNGVNKAQKDAEEITIKNINEVTERSKKYIDAMVQESKRRIERLALITLPDRLFNFGKWVALILVLIILCHVLWQMVG